MSSDAKERIRDTLQNKLVLDIKQLKPMGMGDEMSLVHLRIDTWMGIWNPSFVPTGNVHGSVTWAMYMTWPKEYGRKCLSVALPLQQ